MGHTNPDHRYKSPKSMKIRQCVGLGLAIALTWGAAADARGRGAGVGYTPSKDGTYCTTRLVAQQAKAQINLREGPGTNYKTRHYGISGDTVDFLNQNSDPSSWMQAKDANGKVWYQVGFPKSRAYGWVRSDFVKLPPVECRN
jgi:SH3-like domain-containing protein